MNTKKHFALADIDLTQRRYLQMLAYGKSFKGSKNAS